MIILGLNYIYHDSTACIVKDGKLVVAIEEERITRQKHTSAFPVKSIARCLEVAGITAKDIDKIAVSMKPYLDWSRKFVHGFRMGRNIGTYVQGQTIPSMVKQRYFKQWLSDTYGKEKRPEIHYVPHHVSHVVGSFLVSPYKSAALLSIDGSGEWATSFKGVGRDNTFECLHQDYWPYSLGIVYEAATEFCGFKTNYDEGKTMGLAPLGNPETYGKIVEKIFWINDDMSVGVDFSYFDYNKWTVNRCGKKFYETFGKPRPYSKTAKFEQNHLDVAAAFQEHLEECILKVSRQLHEHTKEDYLVISGGVSLNSVTNGRLVRESGFKDLYVMPAAGDNGTAIGAAFYVYNNMLGNERSFVHDDPFVGTEYGDDKIKKVLEESKLSYTYYPEGELERVTADLLHQGHIIGWFQGRMEIGPRALGNRSILADPTLLGMKDKINAQVKHREAFRPFAPACPIEDTPRYFEQNVADPFVCAQGVYGAPRPAEDYTGRHPRGRDGATTDRAPRDQPSVPSATEGVREGERCAGSAEHLLQRDGRAHRGVAHRCPPLLLHHRSRRSGRRQLPAVKGQWEVGRIGHAVMPTGGSPETGSHNAASHDLQMPCWMIPADHRYLPRIFMTSCFVLDVWVMG